MQRSELKSDLGRLAFDYSRVRKSSIPDEILSEIVQSFMKRNDISDFEVREEDDIVVYVVRAEPSMNLYDEWRLDFSNFGYIPPMIEME